MALLLRSKPASTALKLFANFPMITTNFEETVAKMVNIRQCHKGRWARGTAVWSASPLAGLLPKGRPANGCNIQ